MKPSTSKIVAGACFSVVLTGSALFGADLSPSGKLVRIQVEKSASQSKKSDPLLYRTGKDNLMVAPNVDKATAQAKIDAAGGNAYTLAINNGGIARAVGVVHVNGRTLLVADPEGYQRRIAAKAKAKQSPDVNVAISSVDTTNR